VKLTFVAVAVPPGITVLAAFLKTYVNPVEFPPTVYSIAPLERPLQVIAETTEPDTVIGVTAFIS
jgi:hypothetical protein